MYIFICTCIELSIACTSAIVGCIPAIAQTALKLLFYSRNFSPLSRQAAQKRIDTDIERQVKEYTEARYRKIKYAQIICN